ncbi:FAD-dependent oxidoreductase [Amycolatopsis sp. NPDC004378]
MFPDSPETASVRELTGAVLREAVLDRFRQHDWSERILEVVAKAGAGSVAAFRFNAAPTRARDLAPWSAGSVTALGDAVHATPPTAGMGAGAAIQDAASLVRHLLEVRSGATTLVDAVGGFEAGMRIRGGAVLTAAMKPVRWILATNTRVGAPATAVGLPVLAFMNKFRRTS